MQVVLHQGSTWIGQCIRWQTRSCYSHASVQFADGWHYEAREFEGVHKQCAPTFTNPVDRFTVQGLTRAQVAHVRDFLEAQVGKPYDYSSVLRFVSRRQATRKSSGKWFCSELVFAAVADSGLWLLDRTEPWEVSPGLLARSPLLVPV